MALDVALGERFCAERERVVATIDDPWEALAAALRLGVPGVYVLIGHVEPAAVERLLLEHAATVTGRQAASR
jgi:hypothetical protein